MKNKLFILLLPALLFSCKKAEDRSCFKVTGENAERVVNPGTFSKLWLGPHLRFVLVQDSIEKVVIRGGENLINLVDVRFEGDELRIENQNKCNFLRTYKRDIEVFVHVKKIHNIHFEGTEDLHCQNQLKSDFFTFLIRDGAGKANLDIDAQNLHFLVTNGWGSFNLTGKVNYLKLEINSNGFGDASNIEVLDSVHVISNTQEIIQVKVDQTLLRAQVFADGDIWYKGVPTIIDFKSFGTGELINKN